MLLNQDIARALDAARKHLTTIEFNVMDCDNQYLEIYLANELAILVKKTSNLTAQLGS